MVWIVSFKQDWLSRKIYFGPIFDESLAKRVQCSLVYKNPESIVCMHKIAVPKQQEFAVNEPDTYLRQSGVRYQAWFAMSQDYPTKDYEIYYGPFLTLHDTAKWITSQPKEQWSHPCCEVFHAMFQIFDDYQEEIYPISAEEKHRYH